MPTYTFRGRDMSEAVEQVRVMLGSDAVIIDTLRGTDHIGRFVEITATGELKPPPTTQMNNAPQRRPDQGRDMRGGPQPLPRGSANMRGGGSGVRPPRMGHNGRVAHIGAPSARDYEHAMPQGVGRSSRVARRPNSPMGHPPQGMSQAGLTPHSTANNPNMPPELALLSDPPVKGAERYVHPNSFSTDRGPIIPQAVMPPGSRDTRGHAPNRGGHQVPPSPRGGMRRNALKGSGAPSSHDPRPAVRMGGGHPGNREAQMNGSSQLTPPISRKAVPNMPNQAHLNPNVEDYNPQGVDPWGVEQPSPYAMGANQSQADIGQSVNAVKEIMTQNGGGGEAIQFVTERLNEIVSYIKSSQTTSGVPSPVFDHLQQFQRQLQAAGIESKYAEDLIEQTKARLRLNQLDKQYILAHLGQVLAHNLNCINPLVPPPGVKKNVLAFVGPTGVGKTTTIAKIAAHAQLTHELPVTLISTDTFRMAAVEQLSRYASILDCPAKAAHTPEEMWKAIDEADTPLVLVDTTGRNPKTPGQLKALSDLFGEGWSGRTVLTMAANTREQDLKPIVEGFAPLNYNMVAITKLDETYALGTVYNVGKLTKCPISWTTNGQRVPEDIELANAEVLAVKIIMEAISNKI